MSDAARHPAAKRRWLLIGGGIAIVVLAIAAWFAFAGTGRPPATTATAMPAPAVSVRPVATRPVSRAFEFVGRIKAVNIVEVRARIEGFLDKVLFTEGQDVKSGDLLYQIEKVQFQSALDQAKGNLLVADAAVVNAKLEYDRQVGLVQRQYTPQSVLDKDKADLDAATGRKMQAEAAVTQAQANLDYTDIRSPIDGRIGRTTRTVGNLVNPASGVLATIVSQDPTYVIFPVSVKDLETIREARRKEGGGMAKIEIDVRLANGQRYGQKGTWNLTDPQVDQTTDSLIMRATIPNPDRMLIDGQFVTAIIRERAEEPRLVVPQAALQIDQAGSYVLVVDDQHRVERRPVKTGENIGADIVVNTGLKVGDKVIVDGMQKVRPGVAVQETVLQ
ncbi:MAG TPA: efflux RND transporter periplasmic adaptor subunit [Reyranella sp.]